MRSNFLKNLNFGGVILIVICASLSYGLASYLITHDTIEFSSLPKAVCVAVNDARTNQVVIKNLQVRSRFPVDTFTVGKYPHGTLLHSDGKPNIFLYHENPMFLVWIFLVCAMISIAAGSAPVFIKQVLELKNKFRLVSKQVRQAIGYAIVLSLFLIFSNWKLPGYYDPPSMFRDLHILFKHPYMPECVVSCTIALIIPSLILIFLIGVCSDKIFKHAKALSDDSSKELTLKDIEDAAKKLKYLHNLLTGALQVLAVIVVFSVLTSSALRLSIHSTVEIKGFDLYPTEISMVYGMYFSLFLCIIYLPVYYYIKQNYIRLKELAIDINPPEEMKEKSWYKDLLGDSKFEGTALENIRLAMTMLAPLLTGLLPETLQLIK